MESKFSHKALARAVMVERRPLEAVAEIVKESRARGLDARQTQRVFSNVRKVILRTPEYERSKWREEVPAELRTKPGHYVHWITTNKRHPLYEELKGFRVMQDPFYEFDCPEETKKERQAGDRVHLDRHNTHQKKPREFYHFTEEEIDQMRIKAIDYIQSDVDTTKLCNFGRMLACLSLLTGRRKWELACTLKMRTVKDQPFQAEVSGIAKGFDEQDEWFRIPLLAPFAVVITGVVKARRYPKIKMGRYGPTSNNFFGRPMTHTMYRDIYSETAYKERLTVNHFRVGDESCGPSYWRQKALCVTTGACHDHYSVACIDRDVPVRDEQQHRNKAGLPCTPDRPPERVQPHSL